MSGGEDPDPSPDFFVDVRRFSPMALEGFRGFSAVFGGHRGPLEVPGGSQRLPGGGDPDPSRTLPPLFPCILPLVLPSPLIFLFPAGRHRLPGAGLAAVLLNVRFHGYLGSGDESRHPIESLRSFRRPAQPHLCRLPEGSLSMRRCWGLLAGVSGAFWRQF